MEMSSQDAFLIGWLGGTIVTGTIIVVLVYFFIKGKGN